jgi:hypothetical protein
MRGARWGYWRRVPAACQRMMGSNTTLAFCSPRGARKSYFGAGESSLVEWIRLLILGSNGQPMVMPFNDQGSFAQAITEWDRLPFVLPMNWNFRPLWQASFFGPIKIWHDYGEPPSWIRKLNDHYRKPGAIIQFHLMK